jgi:predicted RNA methylase
MASLTNFGRTVVRSLREEGVASAASFLAGAVNWHVRQALERVFDRRFGTDTIDTVDTEVLDPQRQWTDAHLYDPTPLSVFKKMVRSLPETPSNLTFIDMGCGKGLVLLAAAQLGFQRVIGIEISDQLCEMSRRNVQKFSRANPQMSPIEIVCSDATQFRIPEDKLVLYLFNPFGESLIRQVARNIETRLDGSRTRMYVLYYNPRFAQALEEVRTARIRAASRRIRALAARTTCGFVLYEMGD